MARSTSPSGKKTQSQKSAELSDKPQAPTEAAAEVVITDESTTPGTPQADQVGATPPDDSTPVAATESDPVPVRDIPSLPPEEDGKTSDADRPQDPPAGRDKASATDPKPSAPPDLNRAAVPPTPAPAPAPRRRGGFLALLLGGVLAAGIGFAASHYLIPQGWPITLTATEDQAVTAARADQARRLADLEQRLSAAEAASPATVDPAALEAAATAAVAAQLPQALSSGLDALRSELAGDLDGMRVISADLTRQVTELSSRLDVLEAAPADTAPDPEAVAALGQTRTELAAMRAELAAQREQNADLASRIEAAAAGAEARIAEAEARAAALEQTARNADTSVAIGRLRAAVETGRPFAPALEGLEAALGSAAPDELRENASAGIRTLPALQRSWPEAARAALAASRAATVEGGWGTRLGAFVQSQVGARSLEPREGTDPDAVLSRAEAALKQGDLDTTLDELTALPDEGRAAMEGWIAEAQARQAALAALDEFAAAHGN